jgi:hypothetical protein
MTYVLVSYKREDETRVARLVRALEAHGLSVWWDQTLVGAQGWREGIEAALRGAGCVIVVWTRGSVGPDGEFVRDEAARAKARGVLVPILMDNVIPPLGFGEIQAMDLSHWRGGAKDPFIMDLVEVCRAKLENRPAPPRRAPAMRLMRRAVAGSGAALAAVLATVAGTNLFEVQDRVCTAPLGQPGLSDACGALGLGHRPAAAERISWQNRPPGSCPALREHIRRFPGGVYRAQAADLLAGLTLTRSAAFTDETRAARGYVRQSERPFATLAAAQDDARARAQADALSTVCVPRDAFERSGGAVLADVRFDCRASPGGAQACAADYAVTCKVRVRALSERCG